MHEGRGVVAKLIVQNGTLRVGDAVVCGSAFGRVKAMYDTLRPHVTYREAGPSTPVNADRARRRPRRRRPFLRRRRRRLGPPDRRPKRPAAAAWRRSAAAWSATSRSETLFERLGSEEVATLNIILRADTRGSIEAIQKELSKLDHPEVKIKLLQAMVGGITEADVHLADASDASSSASTSCPTRVPAAWPIATACKSAATTSSTN